MHYLVILDLPNQLGEENCFVGGKPKLPPDKTIPLCALCGKEQDFFFQIAFPEHHTWAGLTIAVFACIRCAEPACLIPEMITGQIKGCNIPKEFLLNYQRNFRFLVFPTEECELLKSYQEHVKFRSLCLQDVEYVRFNKGALFGIIGGSPHWLLEDESPQSYDRSIPMCFLFQIFQGMKFETVKDAPPQIELGLDGTPEPAMVDYYQLFIGNAVYFFGTRHFVDNLVYAITQIE